jgi:RimJ/RimL family protein N-acetyltransferase
MWIVEEDRVAVGVVRLDRIGTGDVARISIALASRARGRGIGRQAIAAACNAWNKPIVAEVLTANAASRTCFEACQFEAIHECDGLITYHWNP